MQLHGVPLAQLLTEIAMKFSGTFEADVENDVNLQASAAIQPFARLRRRIAAGLVAHGMTPAEAEYVVSQIGDGTLLRLILENLDNIAAFIEKLFKVFAGM